MIRRHLGGTPAIRAAGIVAGAVADRLIKDPQRHHPVAVFGSFAQRLEQRLYAPTKRRGAVFWAAAVLPPTTAAWAADRALARSGAARAGLLALSLWAALGGTMLERTGKAMAKDLAAGEQSKDLSAARGWVPWLCSRDPELLDAAGMARATVESLAENTSDATIAPLVWAALGGTPAVVAHRCINTLDAMVGYRSERYNNFGWASAKIDDLAAWLPARVTALTHTAVAGLWHGRAGISGAVRAWRTDAPRHPSPNAGPVEATAAAALGVTLGGRTEYSYGVEMRPTMGQGPAPVCADIGRAVDLARASEFIVVAAALAGLWLRGRLGAGPRGARRGG